MREREEEREEERERGGNVDECLQTPLLCSGGRCTNTQGSFRVSVQRLQRGRVWKQLCRSAHTHTLNAEYKQKHTLMNHSEVNLVQCLVQLEMHRSDTGIEYPVPIQDILLDRVSAP
ncbi:hypothetical protein WMY93_032510 [Mugilogobius chulae]|uniref:Uncharacterized protein n=1 Tax=Mugilogobius chulae TaxID=88201 RepID=A0AAW0MNW4_9GOBI